VAVVTAGSHLGVHPLASAVVAGTLALAMVQFLARGMTSPLREMVRAADAMAQGDYERRVMATSHDEVGELARAFNAMAADLAEVDRVRRDLVANVSHDLRTPISALRARLENLVDGVEPVEPEILETMLKQVERLGHLVDQLLDLSRLESGVVPFEPTLFTLRPMLEEVVEEVDVRGANLVRVVVDPDDLRVEGDADRLHQVVSNLLENAVRHSPTGGTVEVRAMNSRGRVTIEVLDEGPGIPEGDAERVFTRFYRADAARRDDGGGGLGLAIARWVVDLHGGDIRAEARTPRGCRMIVDLPAHQR